MTNAAKPRSVRIGDFSQLSVRRVFCAIWARPGEKTPVARRLAVGALICSDPLRVNCPEDYPFQCLGLKPGRCVIWPTARQVAGSRQLSAGSARPHPRRRRRARTPGRKECRALESSPPEPTAVCDACSSSPASISRISRSPMIRSVSMTTRRIKPTLKPRKSSSLSCR